MFRRRGNHAKTVFALGIVLVLAAGPAHAGGSATGLDWLHTWERLLDRWTFGLFGSGASLAAAYGESGSQIDPNGPPAPGESGSQIDPLGAPASANTNGESSSQIDPDG